jgi:hypothetical protein
MLAPSLTVPTQFKTPEEIEYAQAAVFYIRFESKADIGARPTNVRFTPKSRHGSARS